MKPDFLIKRARERFVQIALAHHRWENLSDKTQIRSLLGKSKQSYSLYSDFQVECGRNGGGAAHSAQGVGKVLFLRVTLGRMTSSIAITFEGLSKELQSMKPSEWRKSLC